MVGIATSIALFALLIIEQQQGEFAAPGQPIDDFEPGRADRAIDKDCAAHANSAS